MAHGMTRRGFALASAAAALGLPALRARAAGGDDKTLRFIAQSDLRVLDPLWTTAYVTRKHGHVLLKVTTACWSLFLWSVGVACQSMTLCLVSCPGSPAAHPAVFVCFSRLKGSMTD